MSALPRPARYAPFRKGRYEISPGLLGLGADFGNGPADRLLFQLDAEFPAFRQAKLDARAERVAKYHGTAEFSPAVASTVSAFIATRLCDEHPEHFRLEEAGEAYLLHCGLTGESLKFDAEWNWVAAETSARPQPGGMRTMLLPPLRGGETEGTGLPPTSPANPVPSYVSGMDALACQVQDDLAVMSLEGERNWVSAVHVCSPSGWVPAEKLGLDYRALHAPVPGMAALNPVAHKLVDAMVHRGPYVRFVWGISPTRRLNRHPEPPPGVTPEAWRESYEWSASSPFVVRVERQCLWPLPEVGASLFLIRLYFVEAADLGKDSRAQLRAGLLSMSSESREYKGISGCFDALTAWLVDPPEC